MDLTLAERDKNLIWHPYTPQKYAPDPIPVLKGKGTLLFAEDGRQYIDAISSWWVTVHGHANEYIARRLYEQALELEQVIFAGFTHRPAVALAERLLPLLPGQFAKIFYSDNGSTAAEVAVKMALQYWWNQGNLTRTKVLALRHGYHGDTFGAMSFSQRSVFNAAFDDKLFDVIFANTPQAGEPLSVQPEVLAQCACVIYEPLIQGAGGMVMYEPAALDEFLAACKQHGLICIADEVMTGFGRTGRLFASEYCQEKPDIICLSKGLTGGTLALSITACSEKIHAAFVDEDKRKTFFHGHSFTANPLACTAALASLDLMEQPATMSAISKIEAKNRTFCEVLRADAGRYNIQNIRHRGTILAFELNSSENNYISDVKERFTASAMKKGVYLRPLGNTVYIMPPYCITPGELQQVYAAILSTLEEFTLS